MPTSSTDRLRHRGFLSPGAWIIVSLAAVTSVMVLVRHSSKSTGMEFWTSAREHVANYVPFAQDWNAHHDPKVEVFLFSSDALSRRMMSGFLSDVHVADMIEVERSLIGPAFAGPLKDVGFVDLTDRLRSEGLLDEINKPSFSPWTTRGHIFGIPHDVHPVMLCYRADIVEAAGIDVSKIETWDDFARVMLPFTRELDAEGRPKHYPLNIWYTALDQIELLILQAGGHFFDENDNITINSDINAHVISTIVSWTGGPNRIAVDAQEFSASGNQLRVSGYVLSTLMPDWLAGVYYADMPALSGKIKVMPLPAWTRGGRRTSVWGGTMLGITKSSPHIEEAWAFAKHIYLNPDLARALYETNYIVSPLKKMWPSTFYDEPRPFFSNQPIGRLYIQQAPNVPIRTSNPYNTQAKTRLEDAVVSLREYAERTNTFDAAKLEPQAHIYLKAAEDSVRGMIEKNVFLKGGQ